MNTIKIPLTRSFSFLFSFFFSIKSNLYTFFLLLLLLCILYAEMLNIFFTNLSSVSKIIKNSTAFNNSLHTNKSERKRFRLKFSRWKSGWTGYAEKKKKTNRCKGVSPIVNPTHSLLTIASNGTTTIETKTKWQNKNEILR